MAGDVLGGFLTEMIPALSDVKIGNALGLCAFALLTLSLWKFCLKKSKKQTA